MIKLKPEQEEEVRRALEKEHEVESRFRTTWKYLATHGSMTTSHADIFDVGFEAGFLAAKGWDKEGEK